MDISMSANKTTDIALMALNSGNLAKNKPTQERTPAYKKTDFALEASEFGQKAMANPTPENVFAYLDFAAKVGSYYHSRGSSGWFLETALEHAGADINSINGINMATKLGRLEILVDVAAIYKMGDTLKIYAPMLAKTEAEALKALRSETE